MCCAGSLFASVSYDGDEYTQDFNSMGAGAVAWVNNSTLAGWYLHQSATGGPPAQLNAPLAAGASSNSNSKGFWFNFGATADRTLGGSPAGGTGTMLYGVALTNNTDRTFTEISVSFDWERWFRADASAAAPQNMRFHWSNDATSLTSGTYHEVAEALLTFTAVPASADRVWLASPEVHAREFTVPGINWPPGATLWLRWQDINEPGGDHGVGINNFAFRADDPPPPPAAVTHGPWSGAITTTGARVNARMSRADTDARLAISGDEAFTEVTFFEPAASHETSQIAAFHVNGLSPGAIYYYAIEIDSDLDLDRSGRFQTFPEAPESFSFVFSACANTGSNHRVFEHILGEDPLFFMNIGDLHYRDIAVNNPDLFRDAFNTVFAAQRQSDLYRNVPLIYMWDDHDYGPNDSDRNSPGRLAALQVYREYIPHYPFPHPEADAPIDQSFSVGRARFIMSDLRSQRDPKNATDNENKRMMSEQQLAWLKSEMLAAKAAKQAIFWISSVPWIQARTHGSDMWGGYSTQRAEIATFLAENEIENVVILAADAHMLAADDGTNTNYSGDPDAAPIRVLMAAALDRPGSVKGGPYSAGTFPNQSGQGQYGYVTVTDHGESLDVQFSGRSIASSTGAMTERVTLDFTLDIGPAPTNLGAIIRNFVRQPNGVVTFEFQSDGDAEYGVYVSEDLVDWLPLGNLEEVSPGLFQFTDADAPNHSKRFYRVGPPDP